MKKKEIGPRPPSRRQLQSQQFAAYQVSQTPVIVHLSNGARLHGLVLAADDFILLLGRGAGDIQPTVVYKRAICLVTPATAPELVLAAPETIAAPEFVPLYIPRTRKRR
ncbi:RNA chaperone Hfq [Cupriavidus necator]|uniref:RNA chaperone Hfq n=1 Tax=Cupriavidus necator TaxID=106590 RepID=UPI00278164E0|nr:RNA chaperone Hfq [Cupriavidus necator]MDQ0139936.1 host factor-I protein [Cupriavidus necator]